MPLNKVEMKLIKRNRSKKGEWSDTKRTLFFVLSLHDALPILKNVIDSFVSLGHWPSAGSFGFNTDILATNPINLSVVLGVLIYFGKGVCASCVFQE